MKKADIKNRIKIKFILGLAVAIMVFFTGCNNDQVESPASEVDEETLDAESIVQADFEDIDDITSIVMEIAESNSGGRIASIDDDRCQCAVITHDTENHTITIDFGDGCVGPNGVVRSGIIFITYDGRRFVPGSTWTITFRNFYVNRRQIEGLRTVTNISESLEANPTFHITLEDGKITWPDETFATREVDKIRVWVRSSNPLLDEFHILTGSTTSGMNRRSIAYKTEVLSDLIYKRNCRNDLRIRIPVQGIKEIIKREKTCVIDFGNGECDTIVEITCGDVVRTLNWEERL